MSPRERIPGLENGQLYSYPTKRWRKKRRQYLMQPQVQLRRLELGPTDSMDLHTISTLENPAAASNEDSKDSIGIKDESKLSVSFIFIFLQFFFLSNYHKSQNLFANLQNLQI